MTGPAKLTKAQFISALAESASLEKKAVASVLDALAAVVAKQLGAEGPGEVTVPGLAKFKAKITPATPEREGVNPFTKEKTVIKAKPASRKVRATPVKPIKDLEA